MFDISTVNKRYFEIKFSVFVEEEIDGEIIEVEKKINLEVESPKVKTLKKVVALGKTKDEDAMDDMAEAVRTILNKNKTNYKVSAEIIDELDFDQLNEILTAFFKWMQEVKNSKN